MILPKGTRLWLDPIGLLNAGLTTEILKRWTADHYDPSACRRALEEILAKAKVPTGWFDPAAITAGGRPATDELLFGELPREKPRWAFGVWPKEVPGAAVRMSAPEVSIIAELIRAGGRTDREAFRTAWSSFFASELVEHLLSGPGSGRRSWPAATEPGIYRREHACLVVHSRTTSLLIDPLSRMSGLPNLSDAPSPPSGEMHDAILVTHGHGDHWNVASILCEARTAQTLVVVPRVPRVNLLTPVCFEQALGELGQAVAAPAWETTLQVGDIEIDVLPFFGEQPTRDPPGPAPGLRSWGNCYRITTPEFSVIVLVDSGRDPQGCMTDVLRASYERRGPADLVLSCLRVFPSPFFSGLERETLVLPFDRIGALFRQYQAGSLPPTTAGPEGIAEACAVVRARHFLPYAHGFEHVGAPITDVGWGCGEPPERELLQQVAARLAARQAPTVAHSWNPGDCARLVGGELAIERAPQV